jgi:hypothetical protein
VNEDVNTLVWNILQSSANDAMWHVLEVPASANPPDDHPCDESGRCPTLLPGTYKVKNIGTTDYLACGQYQHLYPDPNGTTVSLVMLFNV